MKSTFSKFLHKTSRYSLLLVVILLSLQQKSYAQDSCPVKPECKKPPEVKAWCDEYGPTGTGLIQDLVESYIDSSCLPDIDGNVGGINGFTGSGVCEGNGTCCSKKIVDFTIGIKEYKKETDNGIIFQLSPLKLKTQHLYFIAKPRCDQKNDKKSIDLRKISPHCRRVVYGTFGIKHEEIACPSKGDGWGITHRDSCTITVTVGDVQKDYCCANPIACVVDPAKSY